MKKFLALVSLTIIVFTMSCSGQPKDIYTIANRDANGTIVPIEGASGYIFFAEKQTPNANYKLVDGMDYLSPNVVQYQVGAATTPYYDILLVNDGSEYAVGMVALNAADFYGAMGVGIDNVSIVPAKPGGVGLRKKN